MIIAKLAVVALLLFGAVSVAGALSVILALLFGPEDDYERDLADREQMEYIERWKNNDE